MKNPCRKCAPKANSRPLFNFGKEPKKACTRMSSICHSYILVCHPYVLVCHLHVLACHPDVTRIHSYVIRMSLLCTRMSCVCHSYVLVCHPYVTHMYSYVICMTLVRGFNINHLLNKYKVSFSSFQSHCSISIPPDRNQKKTNLVLRNCNHAAITFSSSLM